MNEDWLFEFIEKARSKNAAVRIEFNTVVDAECIIEPEDTFEINDHVLILDDAIIDVDSIAIAGTIAPKQEREEEARKHLEEIWRGLGVE